MLLFAQHVLDTHVWFKRIFQANVDLSGNKLPEAIVEWSSFLELDEVDVNSKVLSRKYGASRMAKQVCTEIMAKKEKGANVGLPHED